MIRDLNYSIRFATVNEFALVHEMTLDEDHAEELHETFSIEGTGVHGAHFTLAQFALLHRAIHEMLRMEEQHRDALTDGAEQQPTKPDPAPDEAEANGLTEAATAYLLMLAATDTTIEMGHPGFGVMFNSGFLKVTDESAGRPTMNREYTISDAGRAVLAAQEPDDD